MPSGIKDDLESIRREAKHLVYDVWYKDVYPPVTDKFKYDMWWWYYRKEKHAYLKSCGIIDSDSVFSLPEPIYQIDKTKKRKNPYWISPTQHK